VSTEDVPKSAQRVLQAAQIRTDFRERKRKREEEGEGAQAREKRRKRVASAGESAGGEKKKGMEPTMAIQTGESLAHFNRYVLFVYYCALSYYKLLSCRRVEDGMRGAVRAAMQTSSAHDRKARKTAQDMSKSKSKQGASRKHASSDSEHDDDAATHGKRGKPSGRSKDSRPDGDDAEVDKHADRPKEFATAAPRRMNDVAQAPPTLALKKAVRIGAGGAAAKAAGVLSLAQRSMMEAERERVIKRYRELKEKRRQDHATGADAK
jgi:hypothetical protein